MTHIIYGDGKVKTNTGTVEGRKCLLMQVTDTALPIGATSSEPASTEPQENFDVIISFKNIEGARLLQDMLNELVCAWSREVSVKVEAIRCKTNQRKQMPVEAQNETGPHCTGQEPACKEAAIVQTKQLRVELDGILQNLRKAELNRRSRERSLAITKLQEAIMWLGMDLKDIGAPTPYPNSYNPANTIVDPTADNLKL